jgi:hypothetical protein
MGDGVRRPEHVGDAHGDDMKAPAQECDIGGGFVSEEFAVPNPGLAGGGLFRHHDQDRLAVDREIIAVEAIPNALFSGKRGLIAVGETWADAERAEPKAGEQNSKSSPSGDSIMTEFGHGGVLGTGLRESAERLPRTNTPRGEVRKAAGRCALNGASALFYWPA